MSQPIYANIRYWLAGWLHLQAVVFLSVAISLHRGYLDPSSLLCIHARASSEGSPYTRLSATLWLPFTLPALAICGRRFRLVFGVGFLSNE